MTGFQDFVDGGAGEGVFRKLPQKRASTGGATPPHPARVVAAVSFTSPFTLFDHTTESYDQQARQATPIDNGLHPADRRRVT